jgi:hypothetical protein
MNMAKSALSRALFLSMGTIMGVSAMARADWTKFATFGGGQNTAWIDESKVESRGTSRKFVEMRDYSQPQNDEVGKPAYLSDATSLQIDCTANTVTTLGLREYAGHMGSGKVVYKFMFSPSERDARSIVAGSVSESEERIVCK